MYHVRSSELTTSNVEVFLFTIFDPRIYAFGVIEVPELFGHDLILALSLLELDQGHSVLLRKAFGSGHKALGHRFHENRGGDGLAPVAAKKSHHPAFVLQGGHINIQIHPVNRLELEGDVVLENLGYAVW